MTTTYKTIEFETTEALREAINSDLSQLAYPYTVKHRTYGEGQLVSVKAPLNGGSLYLTVDFNTVGTKVLALEALLSHRLVEMSEDLLDTLLEAQIAFKDDFEARMHEQQVAARLAREQAAEAKKQAEAEQRAVEHFERAKAKALQDFTTLAETSRPVSTVDEFYYALGWLTGHVGSVSARLPGYLSDTFKKQFGDTGNCYVVDSKKRTSGGYSMQWSFGFKATLRKISTIPAILSQYIGANGREIANTAFVWDLVTDYGFKFGKKQDVAQIKSLVPVEYLPSFEAGLSD